MRTFKYIEAERMGSDHNPMIPGWRVELGTGKDGKEWLCKITPTDTRTHLRWNVDFDTPDEWMAHGYDVDPNDDGWSIPFHRTEVLYAKDYHEAARKYYHRVKAEYKDIHKTIEAFCDLHGIK